jgi:hypothetical protein
MSQEPNTLRIGEVSADGAAVVTGAAKKTTGLSETAQLAVVAVAGINSPLDLLASGRVAEDGTVDGVVTDMMTGGANRRANELKMAYSDCKEMCAPGTPWYMVREPLTQTCATCAARRWVPKRRSHWLVIF